MLNHEFGTIFQRRTFIASLLALAMLFGASTLAAADALADTQTPDEGIYSVTGYVASAVPVGTCNALGIFKGQTFPRPPGKNLFFFYRPGDYQNTFRGTVIPPPQDNSGIYIQTLIPNGLPTNGELAQGFGYGSSTALPFTDATWKFVDHVSFASRATIHVPGSDGRCDETIDFEYIKTGNWQQ